MTNDDDKREPVVLEPEDQKPAGEEVEPILEASADIHATREEAVAEAQAKDEMIERKLSEADDEDGDDRQPLTTADEDEDLVGRGQSADSGDAEEDQDEEKQEAEENRRARKPRGGWRAIEDVFSEGLENFSFRLNPNLSMHMAGKILVSLNDQKRSYVISVSGTSITSEEIKKGSGSTGSYDCEILLSERDFLDLVNGGLNPQVAMLSERVQVAGRLDAAVYLFNLFHAPVRL